jgi:hypothetical protein
VQRRTGLVAAALCGVLAGAACHGDSAQADGPPRPGSITTTIGGVPEHVTVGGSFSPTVTIRSDSPYRIEVEGLYFSLTNAVAPDSAQGAGIDVRWKDPVSGTWRISSQQHGGTWALTEPPRTVWIQPHGTLSVRLYITMNGAAARGTDVLSTAGPYAYSLFETSGTNVSGLLGYNHADSTFFFGAESNGGGTAPTGGATGTAPGAGAGGASWPASSQPSAAAPGGAGDADDGPPGTSPGTDASTDPLAVPAAEPAPTPDVAEPSAGFSTPMPLAALVLIAAAAFGCGVLITRRSRGGR